MKKKNVFTLLSQSSFIKVFSFVCHFDITQPSIFKQNVNAFSSHTSATVKLPETREAKCGFPFNIMRDFLKVKKRSKKKHATK